MLIVQFETAFENVYRLNENVLHRIEIVVHSNETEIRPYEKKFFIEKKLSHNEIVFQSFEFVLKAKCRIPTNEMRTPEEEDREINQERNQETSQI